MPTPQPHSLRLFALIGNNLRVLGREMDGEREKAMLSASL